MDRLSLVLALCLATISRAGFMPPCLEKMALKDLVEKAKAWCDPALVPETHRPPKKISGLYWLKGLPLPDVAACFSRGTWNPDTLTLKVPVWSNFLVKNDFSGKGLIGATYHAGMVYHMKYKDSSLSEADIKPAFAWGHEQTIKWAFGKVAEFPLVEYTGEGPSGTRWSRPSYFGVGDSKMLTNVYEAWKILDADLKPVQENIDLMMKMLPKRIGSLDILHYSLAPCVDDTNEQEDNKHEEWNLKASSEQDSEEL